MYTGAILSCKAPRFWQASPRCRGGPRGTRICTGSSRQPSRLSPWGYPTEAVRTRCPGHGCRYCNCTEAKRPCFSRPRPCLFVHDTVVPWSGFSVRKAFPCGSVVCLCWLPRARRPSLVPSCAGGFPVFVLFSACAAFLCCGSLLHWKCCLGGPYRSCISPRLARNSDVSRLA